jgi:hypothetical protein
LREIFDQLTCVTKTLDAFWTFCVLLRKQHGIWFCSGFLIRQTGESVFFGRSPEEGIEATEVASVGQLFDSWRYKSKLSIDTVHWALRLTRGRLIRPLNRCPLSAPCFAFRFTA